MHRYIFRASKALAQCIQGGSVRQLSVNESLTNVNSIDAPLGDVMNLVCTKR